MKKLYCELESLVITEAGECKVFEKDRIHYGEIPEDLYKSYSNMNNDIYETLGKHIEKYKGVSNLTYKKTLFKKREYILYYDCFDKEVIYKDKIKQVEYYIQYKKIKNVNFDYLKSQLSFDELSELIFDREQELKSMLNQNK